MLLGYTYNKECTHLQAMDIHNLLLEETVSENNTPPYVGKIKNTKKSRSLKYTYQGLLTYLLDLYSNLLLLGITAKL